MEFASKPKVPVLLKPYVIAWEMRDAEALSKCFEEECVFISPLINHTLNTRESVRLYFDELFSRLKNIKTHGSRFFVLGDSTLTVTELTVENPSWGIGNYLMTTAQLQRFSKRGLITTMEVYTDVEAVVKV